MPKDIYVVAIDKSPKQLAAYSDYFLSPAMQIFGVRPTYVPVDSIEAMKKALKETPGRGLLIIDGDLDGGMTWNAAVNAYVASGVDSLEMIVLSNDQELVNELKEQFFNAAPKSVYIHVLKKILYPYGRDKGEEA